MKNTLKKDIFFYAAGTIIPSLIGLIRSPIFTRYFTPEEFGYYSIVTIAFSYLSLILFTSLSACLWRYYNNYKASGKLSVMFSNISFLYLLSFFIILLITLFWLSFANLIVIRNLVFLCFFNYLSSEIIGFYLIIYKLEAKARIYNIIQSVKVSTTFVLLLFLTFILELRIEALLISSIIIHLIIIFYLVFFSKIRLNIKYKYLSFIEIKEFSKFGFTGILINIFLIILLSSDRYIIKFYSKFSNVGIYNQIYNLGQISITALAGIYFSTITPKLTQTLEKSLAISGKIMRLFIKNYVLLILPITVYLSLFSRQLAYIMVGGEFRTGYSMIPFIMLSSFLYGYSQPLMLKLKFENKLTLLIFITMLSAMLNIALNLLLIPVFDYKIAAATTFISYFLLFIFLNYYSKVKVLKYKKLRLFFAKVFIILFAEIAIDLFIRNVLNISINLFFTFLEGTVFLIIFYWVNAKSDFLYYFTFLKSTLIFNSIRK